MMKSLRVRVAAIGLFAAVFTGSAQAAPIFYNWYLNFFQGPLKGQLVTGTLSVDGNDCVGPCSGTFDPNNAAKTLLSLNITVGGVAFTMASDTGFGPGQPYPDVTFNAGHLTEVDFQGLVNFGGIQYELDAVSANIGDLVVFYQTANPTNPATTSQARLAAVPEPGTLALLGAALVGLLLVRRRAVSHAEPGLLA